MRKTFYWKNEQVSATFWEQKKKESPIIFWQTPNRQIIVDFLGFFRRILPISLKIQREVLDMFQAGIILWKPFSDSYVGVFTRFSLGVRGLRVDVSYLKGIKTFE